MLVISASGQSLAACTQDRAIYQEAPTVDGLASSKPAIIRFFPDPNAVVVTNNFRLELASGPTLNGHIIWNDTPARPDGAIMLNCPEGDVTGEELRACTHWIGIAYGLDAQNRPGFIPAADEEATQTLLLTDLARALNYSALNNEQTHLPRSDFFELVGCQNS